MPSETVSALAAAADGLSYQSETDAPWKAFGWPSATGEPDADAVKKRGRHKPDAQATEQSVDEFFAPLTADKDWYEDEEKATAAKYRELLKVIKQRLSGAKVFRIGERKVTIYVVGTDPAGGWAGLKTSAVET
jgi:hypothetical protein